MSARPPSLLLALLLLAPAAQAGPRGHGPTVAVWDIQVADADRVLASHYYARFAEALSAMPELRADSGRVFRPSVHPAEGLTVASTNAQRWRDAAWVAYRGGELEPAAALVADALRLVEPYPAARLPPAFLRDLHLLRGRILLDLGRKEAASAALKAAMILDPTWRADPRWEEPAFLVLWGRLGDERDRAPTGSLTVDLVESGATVLVYGVPQGRADEDGRVELVLPAGIYEVTGRKAGFADRTARVHVGSGDNDPLDLALSVRNSPGFQEALASALADPDGQRGAAVWPGLARAAGAVEARAILVGRFDDEGRDLEVGLFLPGREGWGWYASVPISGNPAFDERRVEFLAGDLVQRLRSSVLPAAVAER